MLNAKAGADKPLTIPGMSAFRRPIGRLGSGGNYQGRGSSQAAVMFNGKLGGSQHLVPVLAKEP